MTWLLMALLSAPIYREYEATLSDCYDGDTCTFDVTLHCRVDGDCGLNVQNFTSRDRLLLTDPPQIDYRAILERRSQHVRLCDINAPELHPGNPPAAVKARDDLVKWIRASKKVHLLVPQNAHGDMYEKYGRLLVYVYADDVNLNEKQLKHGNAVRFIQCK